MPTRLCNEPRCPNPATTRGKCDDHARQVERERSQRRRDVRGPRPYDKKRWILLRRRVLREQPLCCGLDGEPCGMIAQEVDHIRPLADGGDPWQRDGLQALCTEHHQVKTARENSQRGQRG